MRHPYLEFESAASRAEIRQSRGCLPWQIGRPRRRFGHRSFGEAARPTSRVCPFRSSGGGLPCSAFTPAIIHPVSNGSSFPRMQMPEVAARYAPAVSRTCPQEREHAELENCRASSTVAGALRRRSRRRDQFCNPTKGCNQFSGRTGGQEIGFSHIKEGSKLLCERLKGLIPNINNPASVAGALQNLLGGPKNPAETPQQQAQQQPNAVQQVFGASLVKRNRRRNNNRQSKRFQPSSPSGPQDC
jgi:hypothetical protein